MRDSPRGWQGFWPRPVPEGEPGNRTSADPATAAMPLTAHLGELRRRVLMSALAWAVGLALAFWQAPVLIGALKRLAPVSVAFVQLTPGEAFMASLNVALMAGTSLASPVILYHALRFVLPGLRARERRWVLVSVVLGCGLFLLGVAFAYVGVLPPALAFLMAYGQEIAASQMSIARYVAFCLSVLVLCGLTFECPLALLALSLAGVVTSRQLAAHWREAVVAIFLLAAVLTPSQDPLTMVIVGGALLGLYALTLLPMRWLGR